MINAIDITPKLFFTQNTYELIILLILLITCIIGIIILGKEDRPYALTKTILTIMCAGILLGFVDKEVEKEKINKVQEAKTIISENEIILATDSTLYLKINEKICSISNDFIFEDVVLNPGINEFKINKNNNNWILHIPIDTN